MTEFETNRSAYLDGYDVRLVVPQILSEDRVKELDADLPSDVHLVFYTTSNGDALIDAVRAYRKIDIFDAYHDAGQTVTSIKAGYGRIRPNLYTERDLTALKR